MTTLNDLLLTIVLRLRDALQDLDTWLFFHVESRLRQNDRNRQAGK
jgi:hypothetical protein